MTAAQKVIKYIAIAFAIFLIASIIYGIFSVIYELGFAFGPSNDNISEEMSTFNVYKEAVSKLDINVGATNFTIKQGEEFKVETNNKNIIIEQTNEELRIKEKNTKWHFNRKLESELVIYIPENFEFSTVKMEMGAGKIEIDGLTANNLKLQLGAGKTDINNLFVKNIAEIDGGAGEVQIKSSELNNLDFDLGVGEVKLEAKITGKSDIDAGVGSLNINLLGKKDSYKLHINKGVGSVLIDGNNVKDDTYYGEGDSFIDIDGGVGEIKVKFANHVN